MPGVTESPQSPKLHTWLDAPQMDTGAPLPAIHSNDHRLLCAYYVSETVMPRGTVAILRFEHVLHFQLGYPNDEALHGHPLSRYGLSYYQAYLVENSPLVADIEDRNRVHPSFRAGMYADFAIGLLLFTTRR